MSKNDNAARLDFEVALLLISLATLARYALQPHLGDNLPFAFFTAAVVAVACFTSTLPTMVAIVCGSIAGGFLFARKPAALLLPHNIADAGIFAVSAVLLLWFCERSRRAEGGFKDVANQTELQKLQLERALADKADLEMQLKISQEELKSSIENAGVGVHWAGADGKILWVNRAELQLFGFNEAEYVGRPFREFYKDPAVADEIMRRLVAREIVKDVPARIISGKGKEIPVLVTSSVHWGHDGRFLHTRTFTREGLPVSPPATDVQAAGRDERFHAFFNLAGMGMAQVDTRGRFVDANERFCSMIGYSHDELLKIGFTEITHPDDLEPSLRGFKRLLAGETPVLVFEKRYIKKDGTNIWVRVTATMIRDADGKPRYSSTVAEDITVQRAAAESLKQREEIYRSLGEAVPDCLWSAGADGAADFVNRRWKEFTGLDVAEFNRVGWPGVVHPEDLDQAAETWSAAERDGSAFETEFRMRRTDGEYRWFWSRAVPIKDDAGRIAKWVGIASDMTERRQAEAALRESEARLRFAHKCAHAGAWDWHIDTDTLEWSDEYYDIYGIDRSTRPTHEGWLQMVHPEDRGRLEGVIDEALRLKRKEFNAQFRITHPLKGTRWLSVIGNTIYDEMGEPTRMAGINIDMTDRKRTETALASAEERLGLALTAAGMVAWDWDLVENHMTCSQNEPALFRSRSSGFDEFLRSVHPEDRSKIEGALSAALTGGGHFRAEYRVLFSAEGEMWVRSEGRVQYGDDGAAKRIIGVATDISHSKALEVSLQRQADALKHADKRKDEFLAMLAHELRNPLSAISNAIKVNRKTNSAENIEWSKEVIERQAGQLSRLIDDLLDISRISWGKIQLKRAPVDLGVIVDRAVDAVRQNYQSLNHVLNVEKSSESVWVDGDPARLEQTLVNLLSNAAKYSDRGGVVTLGCQLDGDEAVITVRDQGIGIAPEMQEKIFELFSQADASIDHSAGGLGIGLTLARELTHLHDGRLTVYSAGLGKGSEFTVRLPTTSHRPTDLERERSMVAVSTGKVLIVDDNVDSAKGMSEFLRMAGYMVDLAHDGPSALEKADKMRPDAILLDIGLPGMDGYEVATRIRSMGPVAKVKIVAITGYGQDKDRRLSGEAGIDLHLVKPVDYDVLLSVLGSGQAGDSVPEAGLTGY